LANVKIEYYGLYKWLTLCPSEVANNQSLSNNMAPYDIANPSSPPSRVKTMFVVSIFLWYAADALFVMYKLYSQSLGFNIEHTYRGGPALCRLYVEHLEIGGRYVTHEAITDQRVLPERGVLV